MLKAIGVDVREDTEHDWLSYCPFHGNSDTPAFSTSKVSGFSLCFNPACGVGTDPREPPLSLERLVMKMKGYTPIQAKRVILLNKDTTTFEERFDSIRVEDIDLKEFSSEAIEVMHKRLGQTPAALEYLHGRGFTNDTLQHFKVGFAPAAIGRNVPVYRPHDMIMVPAYDHTSKPVGLVGRSLVGKEFKNYGPDEGGRGFHKSKIVWNLNNARKHDTIIITEATFDSMAVHQADYPNTGALLGGTLSAVQEQLLKRHFTHGIIMTDNETDENKGIIYHRHCRKCIRAGNQMCQGHAPGRELGMSLVERLPMIKWSWAMHDARNVYARGVKDARAMTDKEIVDSLRGAISHFDYMEYVA